jgi:hypothetical protein
MKIQIAMNQKKNADIAHNQSPRFTLPPFPNASSEASVSYASSHLDTTTSSGIIRLG